MAPVYHLDGEHTFVATVALFADSLSPKTNKTLTDLSDSYNRTGRSYKIAENILMITSVLLILNIVLSFFSLLR
jgi:hypothetical protein